MTPVQTSQEKEKIERHKHVSQTMVFTGHNRFKNGQSGDAMGEARVYREKVGNVRHLWLCVM